MSYLNRSPLFKPNISEKIVKNYPFTLKKSKTNLPITPRPNSSIPNPNKSRNIFKNEIHPKKLFCDSDLPDLKRTTSDALFNQPLLHSGPVSIGEIAGWARPYDTRRFGREYPVKKFLLPNGDKQLSFVRRKEPTIIKPVGCRFPISDGTQNCGVLNGKQPLPKKSELHVLAIRNSANVSNLLPSSVETHVTETNLQTALNILKKRIGK